ncbi:multicopper oxidase domain-containing protein [Sulfobacillus harzensis]|uniref:Copper-containing nitrite reductase n=1 Tax=Sulfobacillus harzensis TaxID=2729629 RepID=A0A7Y0L4A8_9FIRM|nr:multicopper oxidase domain-containing protein [Sulfobacillus harzensis]NMP21624.1 multicopper oxidase domain-containing protein [Sulfobacillus harzensis]
MTAKTKSIRRRLIGLAVAALAALLGACGSHPNPPASAPKTTAEKPLNQPPRPMTLVRHGRKVTITMYAEETKVQIAPGVTFPAWTFDGTVPGPVIYLKQGDDVSLTLHNLDPRMPHSIDLHAALVAPNQNFTPVLPGQSKTIHFVASVPGVFMYHCESSPMPLHIAQGMYGMAIVTPPGQKPPLYTLVQSEFYKPNNLNAVLTAQPRYVVFNGSADRYVQNPLPAPLDKPFTIAVVNAGPNEISAFHVVGSILRDVQDTGNPQNHLYDVQTITIPPGGGALIHLEFTQPGSYSFVSHAMNQFDRGAAGIFDVKRQAQ